MNPVKYLFFTCGQVGMMTLNRFFLQWIVFFAATRQDGVTLFSAAAVGASLLGFRVFDGVTDPLAGTLSDRWIRSGRKRPTLLWFSFLAPALGLILCFVPTHDMGVGLRWTLLVTGMFLFYVGYTFYAIPYWSLVSDYAPGNAPRRRILSNLLGAGLLIATAIGFVGSPALVEGQGFGRSAIILGVGAALLMILPVFASPSGPRASTSADHGETAKVPSLWASIRTAFRHRRFLGLICLFSGSQMSFTIMTTAAPFIAIDILRGSEGDVAKLLGPLLGLAIPCFIFIPRISAKLGWEKGMALGSIGLAVVYSLTGALGSGIIGSPILTAAILFALGGPMVAALLGLEPEGIVDCAEETGGTGMVGIYMGVFNFVVKVLNGLAIFIAALLVGFRDVVGVTAVRSMSFVAGGCLVIGVILYFCVRPRRASEPPRGPVPESGDPL